MLPLSANRDGKKRRVSAFGLFLAALYAIPSLASIAYGMAVTDSAGHYILLQLPIALQTAALVKLSLADKLGNISWAGAYALLWLPVVLLLYFIGALLGRALASMLQRVAGKSRP